MRPLNSRTIFPMLGEQLPGLVETEAATMRKRSRETAGAMGVVPPLASVELSPEDPAATERARCISILHARAKDFESQKLFNLARALFAVADEIGIVDPLLSRH